MHTVRSTSGSHCAVSDLSYTNSTTKHPRMLKSLLLQIKLASSKLPCTTITQTLPIVQYAHGRITFLTGWQDYQKHSPLTTGVTSQCNAILHLTCYHVQNLLLLAYKALEGLFSFSATPMAPLDTEIVVHMKPNNDVRGAIMHPRCGTYCMLQIIIVAFEYSWPTQVVRGSLTPDTFLFKHHAIPAPDITDTNRIIGATTRLTITIAGVQDAPPKKIEATQSLSTLLLGKVALLLPSTPSILPTPPPPTQVIDKDEPIIIWNPDLVQLALPTHNFNTNYINSKCNTPAIATDYSNKDSPIPSQCTSLPCHHLIHPLQNRSLMRNQLRLCSGHMI